MIEEEKRCQCVVITKLCAHKVILRVFRVKFLSTEWGSCDYSVPWKIVKFFFKIFWWGKLVGFVFVNFGVSTVFNFLWENFQFFFVAKFRLQCQSLKILTIFK